MTWWEKLLEFLRSLFERPPVVVPPPTTTTPPPVTTTTPPVTTTTPPVIVPLAPITADTPFRKTPAISSTKIKKILEDEDSPMAHEFAQIHDAVKGRALPVAQSWRESRYGQDASAMRTHNPLGLLWYQGSPITDFEEVEAGPGVTIRLLKFPTWAAAFAEWARRMDDPNYKGGVYMPALITMEQFIVTYVGGPGCWTSRGQTCANGETWTSTHDYLGDTTSRINRYLGITSLPPGPTGIAVPGWTSYTIAGSPSRLVLPSDIRFRQVLTQKGPNRSGRTLNWTGTTQHETGNERPDANAAMHSAWQDAGTPGHPDGKIGVHFYLDDTEIIQKIPVNEQGVHSGDWRNQQHTAVERCVNKGSNFARSERNAIYLQAGLLRMLGKSAVESLYPHHTKPGSGCPVYIGDHWHAFEGRVDAAIAEVTNR